jgi:NitT/TauT family transport system ATP-binding protein
VIFRKPKSELNMVLSAIAGLAKREMPRRSEDARGSAAAGTWQELVVDNVTLTFNKGKANEYRTLDNASIRVKRGEFYCLVGPSGCGKSTILNLIAGFIGPDSGDIRMGARRIRSAGTDRVVLFQDTSNALFPWLRAYQNVEFGPILQGVPRAEAAERALNVLDLVGLKQHANKFPYELSGGMKQRCQLARALVVEPEVLLMDEPFAALDAISKRILQKELLRIWQQYRMTVIYITHDVGEAVLLAQKVAVMRCGPSSRLKEEFDILQPYPRNPADQAVTEMFAKIESSLEEEVGESLYAD